MAEVIARQRLNLQFRGTLRTAPVAIDPQTAWLTLRIERQTSTQIRDWPDDCTIAVAIVVTADGEEYRCSNGDVGGIHVVPALNGRPAFERDALVMSYKPPSGFFGRRSGYPERLGVGKGTFTAHVEITCQSGAISTFFDLQSTAQERVRVEYAEFQRKLQNGDRLDTGLR